MSALATTAYAKINLALHVRARQADGYHALETFFAFTEFGDALRATGSSALTLSVAGPMAGALAGEGDNLVLRAVRALAAAAAVPAAAALALDKAIPVAAGLGGGSADAAAALRLCNGLWKLGWDDARLAAVGATLGADVAACVASRTVRGEGRGERLSAVAADALAGRPVLLVNPRVAVPTGPVFAGWDGVDRGALAPGCDDAALMGARNDLQAPALAMQPVIAVVLAALGAQPGAGLVRMSGSGATCFALFATESQCDSAASAMARTHPEWWVCPTRLR